LFIIISLVAEMHLMLKKIEYERRIWSTKRSQERLSVIYTFR